MYRISDAVVTRVAAIDTYRVSHRNSVDSIIVHVVKPFGHGIYEIADNPLSGVLTTGAGTACLAGMRLRHIRVPTARRLPGPPRPAATSEPELRQTTTAEHG